MVARDPAVLAQVSGRRCSLGDGVSPSRALDREGEVGTNAAAGLSAPCGERVRASSTARMLATVKA